MRGTVIAVAALVVVGSVLAAQTDGFKREGNAAARALKDPLEGKTPPALQVKSWMNTNGVAVKLKDLKGKVVVLDFWGVWCPPCRGAVPHAKELYRTYKDQGLVFIGVHTTRSGEQMAQYVRAEGINYPVAVDIDGQTVSAFRVDSYPDYYLIDRAGKLRVADLQNGDLDRALKVLLAEKPPAKAPAAEPTGQ